MANPFDFDYNNFRDDSRPKSGDQKRLPDLSRRVVGILGVIFILSFIVDI